MFGSILFLKGKDMAGSGISEKQEQILEYIKNVILRKGYPPSVRDICAAVGLKSTSSVHAHLKALEKAGYIRHEPDKNRSIEITDDSFYMARREILNVPIVGTVTAGAPILAAQNIEGFFPVPAEYLPNCQTFMLKVRGDSMINAGILDGDIILAASQPSADNGDIVIALLEEQDEATVKRYFLEDGIIRLQPENDFMEPMLFSGGIKILGKVIGVFRFMRRRL